MEKSPQQIHEEALAYCEAEHPIWSDLKRRVDRSGALDAQLNAQYEDSNKRMDEHLRDLYVAKLVLSQSVELAA